MSVRPNEPTPYRWTDFHEIWYLSIFFENFSRKLNDKNKDYFTWRPIYNFEHISLISFRMINVSDNIWRENETHFSCQIIFFFENSVVYQIKWKNILQPCRPQTTIWCIRIASWIPKATNTLSECVILIAFPLQNGGTKAAILRFTHIACLVLQIIHTEAVYLKGNTF